MKNSEGLGMKKEASQEIHGDSQRFSRVGRYPVPWG